MVTQFVFFTGIFSFLLTGYCQSIPPVTSSTHPLSGTYYFMGMTGLLGDGTTTVRYWDSQYWRRSPEALCPLLIGNLVWKYDYSPEHNSYVTESEFTGVNCSFYADYWEPIWTTPTTWNVTPHRLFGSTGFQTGQGQCLPTETLVGTNCVTFACPAGTSGPDAWNQCIYPDARMTKDKTAGRHRGCPDPMMGNPIHGGTGNKHEWEEDFLGGGARPLRVERSYNSQMEEDGGLGIGWRTGWSGQAITVLGSPATGAFADRPDGKRYLFRLVSGAWKPDADIVDRLERLTDTGGNTAGWRYTSAGGEIETYTATGALASFADGHGWTWSVATTGTITTVTDPAGRAMILGVDAAGNRTVTLPDSGIITYRKDANNNLVSVTYPDNSIKQYLYEDSRFPHALTGLIDENGDRYASWSYGADGRAIASWHGGALYADQTVLTYNSDGSTGVNDAIGSVRTYGFTPVLGVPRTTGSTQPAGSGCGAASSGVTYSLWVNQ